MACPLFLPASPLIGFSDLYGGECAADPGAIDDNMLRCCNAGYARDSCTRAAQSDADAFRFMISANHIGANQGGTIDVAWSSERNHHPVAVGTLAVNAFTDTVEVKPLERQARVYASAYLRQVGS